MGYTTEFEGQFNLDKPLTDNERKYLEKFSNIRHMKRNIHMGIFTRGVLLTNQVVNLPTGEEGKFFVDGGGFMGQYEDETVIDSNNPPSDCPGLWNQWVPSRDGKSIEWDGGEKFYNYIEWIEFMIKYFFIPWGYTLNGVVSWQGEDDSDVGKIIIKNNIVEKKKMKKILVEDDD